MGGTFSSACGKLPMKIESCPCCGQGIKFSRGFQWISYEFIESFPCSRDEDSCKNCNPFNQNFKGQKFGLLFVGEKFYPSPADFLQEASMAGLSKRIAFVPKELKIGETWIMLAHNKASKQWEVDAQGDLVQIQKPGIFSAFIPTHIEYVVTGDETPEELDALEKRGFTLVNVIPDNKTQLELKPKERHAKKISKKNIGRSNHGKDAGRKNDKR